MIVAAEFKVIKFRQKINKIRNLISKFYYFIIRIIFIYINEIIFI